MTIVRYKRVEMGEQSDQIRVSRGLGGELPNTSELKLFDEEPKVNRALPEDVYEITNTIIEDR